MRFTLTREFYIPKGSIKVADKHSDAVAYIYTTENGKPAMRVFYGKQSKPVARFFYNTEEARNDAVRFYFKSRQASLKLKEEIRAARKAKGRKTEVGTLYYTSWGYEQTNIDWYEVVELVGKTSARVRRVAAMDASTGNEPWMTGKSVPAAGQYIGPAVLVRVTGDSFKVGGHYASRWDGTPKTWTAYA